MLKPKILYNAKDHPMINSGYGIISRHLLPRLGDHYGKDNIIIYAPVYQRDYVDTWEGMSVVGGTQFSFGENMISEHYRNFDCNLLLQVGDAWPLGELPDLAIKGEVMWIQWIPVDWIGMPKNIINRIKPAYKLIPFSKYGEASLRKVDALTNVGKAIWLGLDIEMWKPLPREDYPQVMNSLGFSYDSFNILIVCANQERKRIRQQMEGLSTFRKLNSDVDLRIYIHSPIHGDRDLRADADELGLADIMVNPDPYMITLGGFTELQMVKVFNCADVVLNVCMEGFGLSHTQAQACGVPVVTFSEGAGPELVVFGWEIPSVNVEVESNQMAQPVPNVMAIAQCLSEVWKLRRERRRPLRSEKAVQFIKDNFGWDKICEQWIEVIDGAMKDRERFCLDIPPPDVDLAERANDLVELT